MIKLNKVRRDAPWTWLKLGWRDLTQAPGVSLAYGLIFTGVGALLTLGLALMDQLVIAPVVMSGFALIAPALAIGIYQVSRAMERGEKPRFRMVISRYPGRLSQIAFLSLLLLMLLLLWVRVAQFIFILVSPDAPIEPGPFLEYILTTPQGLSLAVIGTLVGAVLAAAAFAISAIAFPMLVDQDVDAITALVASIRAVFSQPFVMLTWAWLIAFMVTAGIAVFLIGLTVTFPWIAHATWHAYKDFAPEPEQSAASKTA